MYSQGQQKKKKKGPEGYTGSKGRQEWYMLEKKANTLINT